MGPTCIADSWGLLNLEARHIYARISHSLTRARGFVLGMAFPIAPPPARARSRSARRLPMAAAFLAPSPDESPLLLALMDGDKVVQSRPGKFSLWGARLVVGPGGGCDGIQILCCHGGAGQDGRVVDHGRSGGGWIAFTDAVLLSALPSATIDHGCCARLCQYKLLVCCANSFRIVLGAGAGRSKSGIRCYPPGTASPDMIDLMK